jgi:hypothetical protein
VVPVTYLSSPFCIQDCITFAKFDHLLTGLFISASNAWNVAVVRQFCPINIYDVFSIQEERLTILAIVVRQVL